MAEIAEIRFRLTEQDVIRASRLVAAHNTVRKPLFRILVGAALTLIALLALIDPAALRDPLLLMLLAAVALAALALFLAIPLQARRHFRQSVALKDDVLVTWDAQGISFASAHGNSRLGWGEFHDGLENEHMFVLRQSYLLYNVVPKRTLNADQCANFRNCLLASGLMS